MLRSWSDRWFIALRPDAVAVIHRPRRGRQALAPVVNPCNADEIGPAWKAALGTLAASLSSIDEARTGSATVVLSNHFVRYAAIPWVENVHSHDERLAVARLHFEKIHGEQAAQWDVRISPGKIGSPWLACAIDSSLLDELRAVCKQAGISLYSVQPHLMAAANQWRTQLYEKHLWFAVAERDRLVLATLRQGEWSAVRALPLGHSPGKELITLLEREEVLTGVKGKTVHVYAPDYSELGVPVGTRWDIRVLAPAAADNQTPPAAVMALMGNR